MFNDGNWGNFWFYSIDSYVNYTKPAGALQESKWRIAELQIGEMLLPIDASCWNYDIDTLQFRVRGVTDGSSGLLVSTNNWYCKNGATSWYNMRSSGGIWQQPIEEGMVWEF